MSNISLKETHFALLKQKLAMNYKPAKKKANTQDKLMKHSFQQPEKQKPIKRKGKMKY